MKSAALSAGRAPLLLIAAAAVVVAGLAVSLTLGLPDAEAQAQTGLKVSLLLDPLAISEDGGTSTVTASLDGSSSEDVTVTVSIPAGAGVPVTLSTDVTLVIPAGKTDSRAQDVVTLTGVDDALRTGVRPVVIAAVAAASTVTVDSPDDVTLFVSDDEPVPVGDGAYDSDSDFALDAANIDPRGMWSDGSTIWVADADDRKLYAYAADDRSYAGARDVDLHADNADDANDNGGAAGVWSDRTTLWVADHEDDKLYAYSMSDMERDSGRDLTLASANTEARGIWSDGSTMWVVDDGGNPGDAPDRIFTYVLSGGSWTHTASRTIQLHADNRDPSYLWSDGRTLWVADTADDKLYAYKADSRQHDPGKELALHADNTDPRGMWSDGSTLWVADGADPGGGVFAVFAYDLPPKATLALSRRSVPESGGDSAAVTATIDQASDADITLTVRAAPASPGSYFPPAALVGSTLTIAADATASTGTVTLVGIDDDLPTGVRFMAVTATVASGAAAAPSSVVLAVSDDEEAPVAGFGRYSLSDIDSLGGASGAQPWGLWSDGVALWASDADTTGFDNELYAYNLSDGTRDSSRDYDTLAGNGQVFAAPGNSAAFGVWSDGVTLWTADNTGEKLYAYSTSTMEAVPDKDLMLHSDNSDPTGIWSDGVTMWVADPDDDRIYAYDMSDGSRVMDKEFSTSGSGNRNSAGLWSDGTTMWVADSDDSKLYAYKMSDKGHDSGRELSLSGANKPAGLWFDGTTMWVADSGGEKVLAYRTPPELVWSATPVVLAEDGGSAEITISLAELSGVDTVISFSATVDAPKGLDSPLTFAPASATITAGGLGPVAVTVTATDDDVFTGQRFVSVAADVANTEGVAHPAPLRLVVTDDETAALDSFVRVSTMDFDLFTDFRDVWSDGTTVWVGHVTSTERILRAYTLSTGARDTGKDFDLAEGNISPRGIWSDGTTMWVANYRTRDGVKVYAYRMDVAADGTVGDAHSERVEDLEFDMTDHGLLEGVWSDGTTIWAGVSQGGLRAYNLVIDSNGATGPTFGDPVAGRHLSLPDGGTSRGFPQGVWSDGTTIWAADSGSTGPPATPAGLFAYTLDSGARDGGKDLGPLDSTVSRPRGVWFDGETLWIAAKDGTDDKLLAYQRPVTVSLTLTPDTVAEAGGASTVTASTDLPAESEITVTVSLPADAPASLGSNTTLTIAKDAMVSSGEVVVTATPDEVRTGDRTVAVGGTSVASTLVAGPEDVVLTITDDELDLESAVANRDTLTLTYGEDLDSAAVPSTTAFTVTVTDSSNNGRTTTVDAVAVADTEVRLTLSPEAALGDTVTLAYDKTRATENGGAVIRSARSATVQAPSFTAVVVDNDSGADASLASLTLTAVSGSPVDLWPDFESPRTSYDAGAFNRMSQVTVEAEATDSAAAVAISPTDADGNEIGHQVDLSVGSNTVTVTVTAQDGTTTETYTVDVSRAAPGVLVPGDWPLIPDGFVDGDQFRLLAVTTRVGDAVPTAIADYDTRVQTNVMDHGHAAVRPYAGLFKVLGCTADTDARDHTGTDSGAGLGVPVYWLGGAKVADNYADLYDGNWDPATTISPRVFRPFRFTSGTYNRHPYQGAWTWTGCTDDGTGETGNQLGAATVRRGWPGIYDQEFIHDNLEPAPNTGTNREFYYAMSDVFEVADSLSFDLKVAGPGDTEGSTRLHAFTDSQDVYHAGFGPGDDVATITWEAATGAAAVTVSVLDADGGAIADADGDDANGHQVPLSEGLNTVRVQVRSSDMPPEFLGWDFTLHLGRSSAAPGGWRAGDDLDFLWSTDGIKPRGVWGAGDVLWVADDGSDPKAVLAFRRSDGARLDGEGGRPDLDIALSGENDRLWGGIWSDAVAADDSSVDGTMWVADTSDGVLYAYTVDVEADGSGGSTHGDAVSGKDIDVSDHGDPAGMWSDGTTMWVGDSSDRTSGDTTGHKLYAYSLEAGTYGRRVSANDIDVSGAGVFDSGERVRGVAGDGTAIWAFNDNEDTLYAFRLSDRTRESGWDFALDAGHSDLAGVIRGAWHDGGVVYVPSGDGADRSKVYAYNTPRPLVLDTAAVVGDELTLTYNRALDAGSAPAAAAFAVTVTDAATSSPRATTVTAVAVSGAAVVLTLDPPVRNADTVTVGYNSAKAGSGSGEGPIQDDAGIEAADLDGRTVENNTLNSDATLSALTLGSGTSASGLTLDPATFRADVTRYAARVESSVKQVTVAAAANYAPGAGNPGATTVVSPADADTTSAAPGHQVALPAGPTTIEVTVTAADGLTTETYVIEVYREAAVSLAWQLTPAGLGVGDRFRLMARTVASTYRPTNADISYYDAAVRQDVRERAHAAVRPYPNLFKVLGCTATVAARDHTGTNPNDGNTGVPIHWLDGGRAADDYADLYNGWSGAVRTYTSGEPIPVQPGTPVSRNAWTGCRRNGTTSSGQGLGTGGARTYADLRFPERGLNAASTTSPFSTGLLVLSDVFEVVDSLLTDLSVTAVGESDEKLHGFVPGHRYYHAGFDSGEDQATIEWMVTPPADVSVLAAGVAVADADGDGANGHQVPLSEGLNTFTVRVTVPDDSLLTSEYTLHLGRSSAAPGGWRAGDDLDFLWSTDGIEPRGVWGAGDVLWVADDGSDPKAVLAFRRSDGARLDGEGGRPDLDIALSGENDRLWGGIWSDAVAADDSSVDGTMWVADTSDGVLYAYTVDVEADGARGSTHGDAVSGKNIALAGDHEYPAGMWSDGAAIWVGDSQDGRIYAYSLDVGANYGRRLDGTDGFEDNDIDATAHFSTGDLRGVASDGEVVWVLNVHDGKLYGFTLDGGSRDTDSDFVLDAGHRGSGIIRGAWYDDGVVYVPRGDGAEHSKIYAYNTTNVSLVFQPASGLRTGKGMSRSYSVRLSARPLAAVTVTVSGYAGTGVSLSTSRSESTSTLQLTFDTTDWDTPQAVTVAAAADAAAGSVTLAHDASGGGYDNADDDYTVTVVDVSLVLDPESGFRVTEEGSNAFTVRLSDQPADTVTVTVSRASGSPDVSVETTSLVFTTDDWTTAQSVTVTAAADDDLRDDSAELSLSASGGGYGSVTTAYEVAVDDNDTASLVFDPAAGLRVGENSSASYSVKLSARPLAAVTVTVSGYVGTDVSLSTSLAASVPALTLTFTPGDWNTAQTVTVQAAPDDDADNETVTLTHDASGGGFDDVDPEYTVTVTDTVDLSLQRIKVRFSSVYPLDPVFDPEHTDYVVKVYQGTETLSVKATPRDGQTVAYSVGGDTPTLSRGYATVDLSGLDANNDVVLTITVTHEDSSTSSREYTVTVKAKSTDSSLSGLTVGPGTSATGLTLDPAFAADKTAYGAGSVADSVGQVTVGWTLGDTTGAEALVVDADGSELDDNDNNPNNGFQVGLDVGSNVFGVLVRAEARDWTTTYTVEVYRELADKHRLSSLTVTDESGNPVTLSPVFVDTAVSYRATLDASTAWVTLAAAAKHGTASVGIGPDDDEPALEGHQFRVGHGEQATALVTVTASDNTSQVHEVELVRPWPSSVPVSSSWALKPSGLTAGDKFRLLGLTTDRTRKLLVFSPAGGVAVGENSTVTYSVRLSAEPTGNVKVEVSESSTSVSVSSAHLTFSPRHWLVAQTVTVSAAADPGDSDETVALIHDASGGGFDDADADYTLLVADDDRNSLVFEPLDGLTVGEGLTGVYRVRLSAAPTADVTVTVTSSSTDVAFLTAVSASTLTFTSGSSGNWNTAQTVRVSAAADDDSFDGPPVVLSHDASGGGFDDADADYAVTLTEDDPASDTVVHVDLINAESGDILDYDRHARANVADAGHPAAAEYAWMFQALACTSSVGALEHTATSHTSDEAGLPIHWLGGAEAAESYADFYLTAGDVDSLVSLFYLEMGEGVWNSYTSQSGQMVLNPWFRPDWTEYAGSVASTVSQVTVEWDSTDRRATVTARNATDTADLADADGNANNGFQVTLGAAGTDTVFKLKVTHQNVDDPAVYTVTVTRRRAGVAAPQLTRYVARDVSGRPTSSRVITGCGNDGAPLEGNELGTTSGSWIGPLVASVYTNDDGTPFPPLHEGVWSGRLPNRLYALSRVFEVSDAAPSTDATLSILGVADDAAGPVALSPQFAPGADSYTASGFSGSSASVVAYTADENAAAALYLAMGDAADPTWVKVADSVARRVGYQYTTLAAGAHRFRVTVTAEDGSTTRHYDLTLGRGSADATLSGLTLKAGTTTTAVDLLPSGPTGYTAEVANAVSQVTVEPVTAHPGASTVITPADANTATGHQVALSQGENTVAVAVTSENGLATETYTVTVTRSPPRSTDATLSALSLTEGANTVPLDPLTFAAGVTAYTARVANSVTQVTVTATKNDSVASIVPAAAESGHQVDLSEGFNTITVTVIAEDGTTTRTYTVTVVRAAAVSRGWALTPPGLDVGDQFRLLAATVGRGDATSSAVGVYDTRVQNDVSSNGHSAIQSSSGLFRALGCTADTDARDHTATTYTSSHSGVPVYWLGGGRIADGYSDFYDGSWNTEAPPTLTSGTARSDAEVWVGCDDDGTKISNLTLGSSLARVSQPHTDDGLSTTLAEPKANTYASYALSAVFEVVDGHLSDLSVKAAGEPNEKLHGFVPVYHSYHAGFDSGVAQATIDWMVAGTSLPTVSVLETDGTAIPDAAPGVTGHQVDLDVGLNTVVVKATASGNDRLTGEYTLHLGRSSIEKGGWRAGADVDYLWNTDGIAPRGVWGTDSVLWVADDGSDEVLAFDRSTGDRAAGLDIALSGANADLTGGIVAVVSETASAATGTMWVADDADDKLYAYKIDVTGLSRGTDHANRDSGKDITLASGDDHPGAIWSDGATMWVGDHDERRIRAYHVGGANHGDRDSSKDMDLRGALPFLTSRDAGHLRGLASDGARLWVLHAGDGRLYGYELELADRGLVVRDSDEDIRLDSAHTASGDIIRGAWYDADVVYVPRGDGAEHSKIFAYNTRALSNNVRLDTLTVTPVGLSFEATIIEYTVTVEHDVEEVTAEWMLADSKASAETLDSIDRPLDDADGNADGFQVTLGAVGSSTTFKIKVTAEDRISIRTYTVVVERKEVPSDDATLSGLTLKEGITASTVGRYPDPFSPGTFRYGAKVGNSVTQVTVEATTRDANATTEITPADADGDSSNGHQVALDEGYNTITVTGIAEDGVSTTKTYTVTVMRAAAVSEAWVLPPSDALRGSQFRLLGVTVDKGDARSVDIADYDNRVQTDVSSNGHPAIRSSSGLFRVLGCTADTDARNHAATRYNSPHYRGERIYYVNGDRIANNYEDFHHTSNAWATQSPKRTSGEDVPTSGGSSDTDVWVGCSDVGFKALDGPSPNNEYYLGTFGPNVRISKPHGSSGLATSSQINKNNSRAIYALSSLLEVVASPLTELSVTAPGDPVDSSRLHGFVPGYRSYHAGFDHDDAQATIDWTVTDPSITTVSVLDDAGTVLRDAGAAAGHQVNLTADEVTTVTVRVAVSGNGLLTSEYTLHLGRGSDEPGGWSAGDDVDYVWDTDRIRPEDVWGGGGRIKPRGVWGVGNVLWVADDSSNTVLAFDRSTGARLDGSDSRPNLDTGLKGDNDRLWGGIWSDAVEADDSSVSGTMWVADTDDDKLYAYKVDIAAGGAAGLTHGDADADKDITLSGHDAPAGMWSDGATMWVGDYEDNKLYAYDLSTGSSDTDKDIDTASVFDTGEELRGVASDGTAVWVLNEDDRKLYGFELESDDSDHRVADWDFGLHAAHAGGDFIRGAWYDDADDIIYVPRGDNAAHSKIFAYNTVFALVLAPESVTVREGGSSVYGVKLSSLPSDDVTVSVSALADSDLVLSSAATGSVSVSVSGPVLSLTFATNDWDTFQSVTVHADEDADMIDDTATLRHSATGGGYDAASGDVSVTVEDDDIAELVLAPESVSVREGGSSVYGVKLSSRPSDDVTVSVSALAGGDLVFVAGSVSVSVTDAGTVLVLTFGTGDWDTFQSVTVYADEDADIFDDTATLRHTASGGRYNAAGDVAVTVEDDDVGEVVLDPESVSVREGGSSVYGVKLSSRPSDDVTVVVSALEGGDLVFVAGSVSVSVTDAGTVLVLTFGTGDWNMFQSVTVHAGHDDDAAADWELFTHYASGGSYDRGVDMRVSVSDDDHAELVFDRTSMSVQEGSSAKYGVRLSARPLGEVSVAVTAVGGDGSGVMVVSGASSVSVSDSGTVLSLTFGTGDWDTFQSVTVRAGHDDDDIVDESVVLRHAASGGGYSVSGDVSVAVVDDDSGELVFDRTSVSVQEGSSGTYGVRLSARPAGEVSVAVTAVGGDGSGVVVVSGASSVSVSDSGTVLSLTFGTGDWDTFQSVTVRAGQDDDTVDESMELRHAASGGGYSVSGDVAVTVIDDDSSRLVFDRTSVSVQEGSSGTYGVRLSVQPLGEVSVAVTAVGGDGSGVVLMAGASSVSVSDWGRCCR